MLYIKAIGKNRQDVKVIYSKERPDIEFIWSFDVIKNAIEKGHEYRTVITKDGKLIEGAKVEIHNDYLTTHKNNEIIDNLNELPTF